MLVAKKDKAYFISFDPRIDADSGMFIKEIARDQADIDLMIEKIKEATEAKKSILNKLK
jgi:3-hydroxyacyl-CoA dehydrogenase